MRFWVPLLLLAVCTAHCFLPPQSAPSLRRERSALCLKRSADIAWDLLESAKAERELIKLKILDVIGLQRGCKEGSKLYLELDRKFIELLEAEDEAVLRISRLVEEAVATSKLSKNATSIYRSYFRDA